MSRTQKPARKANRNGKPTTRRRAEEVVAAAVKIFNERGYAATSVEDVADALGILKGSLYYYIDSKEDLLFEIVSEVHEGSLGIIAAVLGRTDLDARQRLALYIHEQVRYNATNVTRVAVYYRDVDQLSEPRLSDIRVRQAAHFRALVELIREAQAGALVGEDINPALAAHGVLSTIIWPYTWYGRGTKLKPETLAEFCVQYVLGGLEDFAPLTDARAADSAHAGHAAVDGQDDAGEVLRGR